MLQRWLDPVKPVKKQMRGKNIKLQYLISMAFRNRIYSERGEERMNLFIVIFTEKITGEFRNAETVMNKQILLTLILILM